MNTIKKLLLTTLAFSMFAAPAVAENLDTKNRNQDELRGHLWEMEKDSTKVDAAVSKGKKLTEFCVICHGKNGISRNPWEPNLAEQNSTYLLDQLILFANGKRRNLVMNDLASKFTDGELIDIAIYYANMKNEYVPTDIDAAKIVEGKTIYQKNCVTCHGATGKGNVGFASLSGQKTEYLINNLNKFKGDSRRSSNVMGPIVAKLSSKDIEAVASYITSMNITQ